MRGGFSETNSKNDLRSFCHEGTFAARVPHGAARALGAQALRGLETTSAAGSHRDAGGSLQQNAILTVEFAEQLRGRGMPLIEAAVEPASSCGPS
jgi:multidrug efflux pump subunit AcrB